MSLAKTCAQCAAPLPDDAPDDAVCAACAAAAQKTRIEPALADSTVAAQIRETIGDYEVIDKLGQGGMGAVYRARQVSLGRMVALKVLPEDATHDPESVSRFEREARVAARLTHPNLVRVYASGHANGCHFIAMELIEGENLHQRLRRGAMAMAEALRICTDVARGLQCGWQTAQLIHRDIKPSNIYLSTDGTVKLGDLGLAKSLLGNTTGLTQTGTMMGTPHYISPEQARADANLDFRADIYSLGCTLFECLAGRTPYTATDALTLMNLHVNAPPPAILKVMPQCPIPLARLVSKMLKKSKHERHTSYDDLVAEMENVMQVLVHGDTSAGRVAAAWRDLNEGTARPLTTAKPEAPKTVAPTAKSKLLLYAAIAAGVLVIGFFAFLLSKPKKPRPAAVAPIATATKAQSTPTSTPVTQATAVSPGWQPLVSEAEWKKSVPGRELIDGLLHLTKRALDVPQPSADAAIRARIHIRDFDGYPEVHLRSSHAGKYLATLNQSTAVNLYFYPLDRGPSRSLGKYQFPQPLKVGDTATLELRAQGSHLTVLFNDKVVIEADDTTLTEAGNCGLYASGEAWFESAEVRALPGAATPAANAVGDTIELLPLVDVKRDAIKGTWSVKPDGLALDRPDAHAVLELPYEPPEEYNLLVEFTATTDGMNPNVYLAAGGSSFAWKMNAHGRTPPLYGFDLLDGKLMPSRSIGVEQAVVQNPAQVVTGQRSSTHIDVRRNLLKCEFQGQDILTWSSDFKRLSMEEANKLRNPRALGLGSYKRGVTFHRVTVREISGMGKLTTAAKNTDEPWQDLLRDPAKLVIETVQRTSDGLAFAGAGSAKIPGSHRDGAVRFRTAFGGVRIAARVRQNRDGGIYALSVAPNGDSFILWRSVPGSTSPLELKRFPLPQALVPGQEYEIELRVVGNTLTARYNGQTLGSATDTTYDEGVFSIAAFSKDGTNTLVRSVHFLDLDAPSSERTSSPTASPSATNAPSSSATATKDSPFVNSLGMKFVPVPITGGPTDGKRVLFSVWETRVQDYAAFATETKRSWAKQEETHPAANVSWEDATAFCVWLTDREHKAGRLGAGERYRLPTDHEWSCAVGIGDQEDPARPALEKAGLIKTFPWGTAWPPPAGAGNYYGEECASLPDARGDAILTGYRDPFTLASPVGSFAPSTLGLYDLGGNVFEWCEDAGPAGDRIVRGGSFTDGLKGSILSSRRAAAKPGSRFGHFGFRVVLAPAL